MGGHRMMRVHIAGPVGEDRRTQRCALCGATLFELVGIRPGGPWVEGALIEAHEMGTVSMLLGPGVKPTCMFGGARADKEV